MKIFSRSRLSQAGQGSANLTGCLVVAAVGAVVLALGFLSMVHIIDPGHVGIKTSFGSVQQDTLKPGANILFPPFAYDVTDVDTRVRGIEFGTDVGKCRGEQPDPKCFGSASIEYQDVWLVGTLNIHVDQNAAVDLYTKVGLDYDQKLVIPFFSQSIKEVVPTYKIGDILAHRPDIASQAVTKLNAKLNPYGIVADGIALVDVGFSQPYTAAVEAKQVAEQQVQTESQILAQKKIQAQQVTTTAQGAADAAVIAAQGEAKAIIERANGQAQANKTLTATLTPELIQYTLINKIAPTIQTLLLPAGQNFILDPSALVKPQ